MSIAFFSFYNQQRKEEKGDSCEQLSFSDLKFFKNDKKMNLSMLRSKKPSGMNFQFFPLLFHNLFQNLNLKQSYLQDVIVISDV